MEYSIVTFQGRGSCGNEARVKFGLALSPVACICGLPGSALARHILVVGLGHWGMCSLLQSQCLNVPAANCGGGKSSTGCSSAQLWEAQPHRMQDGLWPEAARYTPGFGMFVHALGAGEQRREPTP